LATRAGHPTYVLSRWLFLRLLGVVYFVAFVSLALQITGLVGEHGILPATGFLQQAHAAYGSAAYRLFPTVCWLGAGDGMLRALGWGGAALALLLVAGVAQAPVLLLLWLCYLSLAVVGQAFLWFQWDGLLLETGLLAVLYAPTQLGPSLARERAPSAIMRWLVWALVFRLMFLSGITKLVSGDPMWRHLTALDYHFWTQPLPPWPAWYAHWLPEWMHRGMTLAIIAIEVLVPWLIVVPERWAGRGARRAACGLLVFGQLAIALTGNYGFFNLLAIVLCLSLLDDAVLGRVLPVRLAVGDPEPRWKQYAIRGLAPLLALLAALAFVREIAQTRNPLLDAVAPLRSVNGYGLFRVMTTERYEIAIGAAHAAARLANVVRGARSGSRPGLARAPAAAPARRDARGTHPARREPVSGRAAPLRASRVLPLPLQHADRAGRGRRLVAAGAGRVPDGAAVARGVGAAPLIPLSSGLSSRLFQRAFVMKATDIRRGHVIMIEGQPCRVMDFTHRTPGNLRAFVQVRFRNLVTGNTFDTRLAATDFVDEAPLETKEFQVLYRDQGGVHVMDTTSYEQHTLDAEAVGDHADWLQPEMHIQVEWLNGRPVGIELPSVVELTVVQTSPVMRGATKTASTKPAKLSNGVTIQVPEFISEGEKVRVDPREGAYLERAK